MRKREERDHRSRGWSTAAVSEMTANFEKVRRVQGMDSSSETLGEIGSAHALTLVW